MLIVVVRIRFLVFQESRFAPIRSEDGEVLNSQSGDVTVIQKRRKTTKLEPGEYTLLTMIPVGSQPNNIVVKAFVLGKP